MLNLLTLSSADWQCHIRSNEVAKAQAQLRATMQARGLALPRQRLRLLGAPLRACTPEAQCVGEEISLEHAIFFENRQYSIEIVFGDDCSDVQIQHPLSKVCDAFYFSRGALFGTLNFGNDIGWFRLPLQWMRAGRRYEASIVLEVLPTKMHMHEDLQRIYQQIDQQYPLWRFSFAKKTDQELAQSTKPHERFPLLWLAHFRALREELQQHVSYICHAPHRRLQSTPRRLPLERMCGRLSPRLEQALAQVRAGASAGTEAGGRRKFPVDSLQLASDTVENRFVKMVLQRCVQEIANFCLLGEKFNRRAEGSSLSASFFAELASWQQPLREALAHPLFAQVGKFDGSEGVSLVLQQRAGYSGVYRIWQQLKLYLDVFAGRSAIALKSVSDLYEVWCFLEVRRHLLQMGFQEVPSKPMRLRSNGIEKQLRDGLNAAFTFVRGTPGQGDYLRLRLAHEPVFGDPKRALGLAATKLKKDGIYSWTAAQKPDILLTASFANGEEIRWIFDAKYRIATTTNNENEGDRVPEDALNQMHRYRDALIYIEKEQKRKSRPIIGACVLYPGWFNQEQESNPYAEAIEEVGIGALALLPGMQNVWLGQFLQQALGGGLSAAHAPDEQLAASSVRIPPHGMRVVRYTDLALVAQIGRGRDAAYVERFEKGRAMWYHTPLFNFEQVRLSRTVLQEITHCAIEVNQRVEYVYAVKSACIVPRSEISREQAGGVSLRDDDVLYCLFELGPVQKLEHAMVCPESAHFQWKLTSSLALFSGQRWQDLPARYTVLQGKSAQVIDLP